MRVILVGRPRGLAKLRAAISGLEVVDEAASLAEARASGLDVDGYLVAPDSADARDSRTDDGFEEALAEPLTPREREVLELLAEGLSNKAIGGRLGISDQTVKFHVAAICGKLGAANRTEAVRLALRRGLITL